MSEEGVSRAAACLLAEPKSSSPNPVIVLVLAALLLAINNKAVVCSMRNAHDEFSSCNLEIAKC
jgi:hypothetical protein